MNLVMLILGFAILIKGADFLIDSASKLAKLFGIPTIIIGLTIVAFGTSAPELAIGISSAIKQANTITLGDVIGSCIANVALIIGITSIIMSLKVDQNVITKEIPISFGLQVILYIMLLINNDLSRIEGMILVTLFIIFLFYIFRRSKELMENELKDNNLPNSSFYKLKLTATLILGLAGLVLGANLVVNSSINIATSLGLSKTLIGLTIVAIGTSLPELVTCIVAALKKQDDIAVGNIVGSNIFNVISILGISSLIYPIKIAQNINFDIIMMCLSTILLFSFSWRSKIIARASGIILILFYITYILVKIFTI